MKLPSLAARLCCALIFIIAPLPGTHANTPDRPHDARETKAIPAGEVTVVLPERLFNALFDSLFALPQPPTVPLPRIGQGGGASDKGGGCASEITLAREQSGTRTGVRFVAGQINAPLAFKGSYSASLLGCLRFQGWADTNFNLTFDQARQVLVARVVVGEVHLSKVPALMNSGITGLVQDALDARVNPIEILRADQLSLRLPLTKMSNSGALRLRAKEVRHEVAPGELRVRIVYEFVRED